MIGQTIIERFEGDRSTRGEKGWIVAEPSPEDPVQTIICDSNWDGPVALGGIIESAGKFDDGRPRFRCRMKD